MFKRKTNSFQIEPKPENREKVRNYIIWLLSKKEYTQKQLLDKLHHHKYHQNDIDYILKYIVDAKFQSDERFAENFIKAKQKKYGRSRLLMELKQKGVDETLAKRLLDELLEDGAGKAKDVLLKKFDLETLKSDRELYFKKHKNRIVNYMLSRGFSYSDFKDLL